MIKTAKLWVLFLTSFQIHFGATLGAILGALLAPRPAQEEPRGAQESQRGLQEAKNAIFEKMLFALDFLYFFVLETSQDGHKMPRRLPKSVTGELPDLKRWLPTRTPKNVNF